MPCLGLCLGLQAMTIEFARNVLGLTDANSTEFDPTTQHPVIDLMHDQRDVTDKGGTMRLGAYYAVLEPGTKVAEAYGEPVVSERHRHRYEFNSQLPGPPRGRPASSAAARRRTGGWSSSSSSPTTRSGSARRPIRSSRAAPTGRTRCSASWSAPRSTLRAERGGRRRRRRRRGASRRRLIAPDGGDGFRHLDDRLVHQGHVWRRRRRPTSRRPTASVRARHRPLAGRGRPRCRWCSTPRATRRWCSCASTGRRTTGRSSRSRPGCATSPASRPRRRRPARAGRGGRAARRASSSR